MSIAVCFCSSIPFFFFLFLLNALYQSLFIYVSFFIKYFSPCFGNVAVFRFVSEWEKIETLQRTKLKYDFERTVREV